MYTDSGILLSMPKVTIYIRNDDYPKWQAIADKPEWLHEHLNGSFINHDFIINETLKAQRIVSDPTYTDAEDTA